MRWRAAAAALLLSAASARAQVPPLPPPSPAEVAVTTSRPLLPRDGPDAAAFRGSLVFMNYCVTCHGPSADGAGRAAKLYNPRPANLRKSGSNEQYIQSIVRSGGRAVNRSEYMPPWGEELTNEQIRDVTSYLLSLRVAP